MEYKIRLMKLGMKQVDLLKYMIASGYEGVLKKEYVSLAINGEPGARFDKLREDIDKALTRKEAERERMQQTAEAV